MGRRFFGTDGIRGLTNSPPMTAETAMRVGMAAGAHFVRGEHRRSPSEPVLVTPTLVFDETEVSPLVEGRSRRWLEWFRRAGGAQAAANAVEQRLLTNTAASG